MLDCTRRAGLQDTTQMGSFESEDRDDTRDALRGGRFSSLRALYWLLHSSSASNMATMFSGGTSGRMLWTGLKTKPPSGMKMSNRFLTCSFTSAGVPCG